MNVQRIVAFEPDDTSHMLQAQSSARLAAMLVARPAGTVELIVFR
jgi:hypothetical protein